ncbi:peptidylprolyl isomerase [Cetobacterium somerae]|uniref:peptidylprolyl isomerase n=1 Tax=Cetobacterium sp. NK01 TaxID=2993530 RepID=UPI002115CF24|nr:peptidylprolyl isomerase [Cetobacterium sp. NK01]MCQ8211256.1 peptidylprolyl isomerase [Cetobacterium sp. NK01]
MAIRKFRRNMKPVIWVVTIFFFISLIAGYAMSFKNTSSNSQLAFKLNGKKVTMVEAHRSMAIMSENYKRYLGANIDPELMNTIAFNELINKNLLLEMADKLKIKVSNSEVDAQMDQIKAAFPDKEQFKNALLSQGYTTKTLEKEIKENLILQKVSEAITGNVNITPEEINEYYSDYKYTMFQGKPLEEVKAQIEQALKTQKGAEVYAEDMTEARAKMKLQDLDKNFDAYVEKEAFEFDGVKVNNVEYAKRVLNALTMTKGDLTQAKELAKSSIESEIKLLKAAEAKGVKVNEALPLDLQVANAVKELYSKLKSEITYTQNDLKDFFQENQINYDTLKSADANIAILKVQPTEEDDAKAKVRAEELLKKVNKENFAEMAKKYSEGPSGPNGGALGTFKKGDMVKPFEDAAFTGVAGEVYPEVVKTQFGYHIIFVESKDNKNETVTASHILIIPEPSEETLNAKDAQVSEIVKDLNNKTITFEDLKNDKDIVFSEKIDGITEEGYVPGLGYNEELAKSIYDSKLGEVGFIKEQKDFIIYRKDSQVDEKKANFEEFENQVKADYVNTKAQEALKEIELSTQNTEN